MKPIHAKPSLYAHYFLQLKEIAVKYGYNLVLHGSMNRDLDLIAIPWTLELGSVEDMMKEFTASIGGTEMVLSPEQRNCFPHGRQSYVINLNRGTGMEDPQYYIDISVLPGSDRASHIEEPEEEHETTDCPKCGNSYDDADQDFLICSRCGYDALAKVYLK